MNRCRPGQHTDPTGHVPDHLYTPPPDNPTDIHAYIEGRDNLLARRTFWQANYLTALRLDHAWRQQQATPEPPRTPTP